ncbi:hypothetical protein GCM10023091_00360 [Ravibacter arvi]|uniref:Uncharacterized protein n=1 Tax=Ravibacter arvi TaxID=2051041 RepID=A0ABP8LKG1_9BACT
MKKIKKLTFKKKDIIDLTKDEQRKIIGGFAETYTQCTDGCGGMTVYADNCTSGCTSDCASNVGGGNCDPASGLDNATCYISAADLCHTDRNCTYARCTEGCPHSYGDPTCGDDATCKEC